MSEYAIADRKEPESVPNLACSDGRLALRRASQQAYELTLE